MAKIVDFRKSLVADFEDCTKNDGSYEGVIKAISVLNARSMTYDKLDCKAQERMEKDITDFMEYFYDRYGDDELLFRKIQENWPDMPPRIFRMAEFFVNEKMLSEAEKLYKGFSDARKSDMELLFSYIMDMRRDRFVTINLGDCVVTICFERTMKKKDFTETKRELRASLIRLFDQGGSLVFRRLSENGSVVNGFFVDADGLISSVPTDDLKDSCCIQPDGSYVELEDEAYEIAPLIFNRA